MKLTADPATTGPDGDDVRVVDVMPGIHRVDRHDSTLGYVVEAGRVQVALRGAVYNTAVEIGQTLDLDRAVGLIAAAAA